MKRLSNNPASPPPPAATTSTPGITRYATDTEAAEGTTVDAALRPQNSLLRRKPNGAIVSWPFTNYSLAHGNDSLHIVNNPATFVATGIEATAVGTRYTRANGLYATALGCEASCSAINGVAVGRGANANGWEASYAIGVANAAGRLSVAMGYSANATAEGAIAVGGYSVTASGLHSAAIGTRTYALVNYVAELGANPAAITRGAGVRLHGQTGMVAMTIQNRPSPYNATTAAKGAEPDNTLAEGMFALRRNGDDVYVDLNIGGTIKTLHLGTAS